MVHSWLSSCHHFQTAVVSPIYSFQHTKKIRNASKDLLYYIDIKWNLGYTWCTESIILKWKRYSFNFERPVLVSAYLICNCWSNEFSLHGESRSNLCRWCVSRTMPAVTLSFTLVLHFHTENLPSSMYQLNGKSILHRKVQDQLQRHLTCRWHRISLIIFPL